MGQKEEMIDSKIGTIRVSKERIIHFPKGLVGFERFKAFVLVQLREDSPFLLLQSLDNSALGLLVADPYSFLPEYEVVVGEAEKRILQIEDASHVAVLVTVSIPAGDPENTTLNLSGPILINYQSKTGLQIPQTNPKCPAHFMPGKTNLNTEEEQENSALKDS